MRLNQMAVVSVNGQAIDRVRPTWLVVAVDGATLPDTCRDAKEQTAWLHERLPGTTQRSRTPTKSEARPTKGDARRRCVEGAAPVVQLGFYGAAPWVFDASDSSSPNWRPVDARTSYLLETAYRDKRPQIRVDVYVEKMRATRTYAYDLNRMEQRFVSSGVSRADLERGAAPPVAPSRRTRALRRFDVSAADWRDHAKLFSNRSSLSGPRGR